MMSLNSATLQPSPTAGPFTAAMTGSGKRSISSMICAPSRMLSSRATGSSRNEVIQFKSPPAQNARPRAGQDDDLGLCVGGQLPPDIGQGPVQVLIDTVELGSPVDQDGSHGTVGVDGQLVRKVVFHRILPRRQPGCSRQRGPSPVCCGPRSGPSIGAFLLSDVVLEYRQGCSATRIATLPDVRVASPVRDALRLGVGAVAPT